MSNSQDANEPWDIQQARWEPKGGGQGGVLTLTVVTAIEGGDISTRT